LRQASAIRPAGPPGQQREIPSAVTPKTVANWVTGELFRLMNAAGAEIAAVRITPEAFAELLELAAAGQINLNSAKRVFGVMFETGRPARAIVQELGLTQVSDVDALAAAVAGIIGQYPDEVARYRGGKESLFNWFLGQVMRETRGKGNPAVVKDLLREALTANADLKSSTGGCHVLRRTR